MWQNEPVAFGTDYRPEANRLTNALRLIWIIPALIVAIVVTIGQSFVLLVSWFAIVITGRQSRGMFDFILARQPIRVRPQRLFDADDRRLSALRRFGADEHVAAGRPRTRSAAGDVHRSAVAAAGGPAGRLSRASHAQ